MLTAVKGSEIEDNALCGGGDLNQGVSSTAATISAAARANIKAVIWAGNPRNSPSESSFHVGSCTNGGVSIVPDRYPPHDADRFIPVLCSPLQRLRRL